MLGLKKNNEDKSKPKPTKTNENQTNPRTNKNKQTLPHKEKILDIISLDEPKIEKPPEKSSLNVSEEEKLSLNSHFPKKIASKAEKKRKNLENEKMDKDETNSLPEKSYDYYEEEKKEFLEGNDKDLSPPLEIKASRKAESMYIEVSDVDKEIIKLFLSEKFGLTQNSRFSFANSKSSFESKINDEKSDLRRSMQEFLKSSLSPTYSPLRNPTNCDGNGIHFEKFTTNSFL